MQRATFHFFLFYDYSTVCICHIFFNQSSVNGHFGHFHNLTIVYNVAMFRCIPRSGIAGSNGSCLFSFWESSILFSIVSVLIYIPTNSVQGFLFSTSSITFIWYLMTAILTCVRWYPTVILLCISLVIRNIELFHVPVGHLHLLFAKCLFGYSAHFEIVLFGVLMLSYMSCLHMLDINHLLVISFRNSFSPFSRLSFYFIAGFLCFAKAFKFN